MHPICNSSVFPFLPYFSPSNEKKKKKALMLLRHVIYAQRSILSLCQQRRPTTTSCISLLHTATACWRQSAAVIPSSHYYHHHQDHARPNLNVIDFFDPALNTSTPHYYSFLYGAAGFPKSGKVLLPTPQEDAIYSSIQVGDDAYFQRPDALGVADGVGGWRSHKGNFKKEEGLVC